MKSFDEILKEGKDKAKTTVSPLKKWKSHINTIMDSLHKLNELYDNDDEHHLKIEQHSCERCKKASFVLAIRDINNRKRVIRFHRANWEAVDKGVYYCSACKKGRK